MTAPRTQDGLLTPCRCVVAEDFVGVPGPRYARYATRLGPPGFYARYLTPGVAERTMKKRNGMNRRKFLHAGALWAAGSSAAGGTALSYGRIAGSNDRISVGHVGIGTRGKELDGMTSE